MILQSIHDRSHSLLLQPSQLSKSKRPAVARYGCVATRNSHRLVQAPTLRPPARRVSTHANIDIEQAVYVAEQTAKIAGAAVGVVAGLDTGDRINAFFSVTRLMTPRRKNLKQVQKNAAFADACRRIAAIGLMGFMGLGIAESACHMLPR